MAKNILHMLTPLAHMSPFDVNMAADAGFDVVGRRIRTSRSAKWPDSYTGRDVLALAEGRVAHGHFHRRQGRLRRARHARRGGEVAC